MRGIIMKKIVRFNGMRIVLIIELIAVVCIFFYSPHGYALLKSLAQQRLRIEHDIARARESIASFEQQIDNWEKYPFYKEKYCCENLQMMHPEATVYYISP